MVNPVPTIAAPVNQRVLPIHSSPISAVPPPPSVLSISNPAVRSSNPTIKPSKRPYPTDLPVIQELDSDDDEYPPQN
jgi:hypothetical protein